MPVLLKLVQKLERQDTIPVSLSKARVTLISKPNEDTARKTFIGQTLYEKMADRLMQFQIESREPCPCTLVYKAVSSHTASLEE